MSNPSKILVVAATMRELAPAQGWISLHCGVGPVDAAASTIGAVAARLPHLIVHVGIAGARRARGFAPGALVIGSEARYTDLSVPASMAPSVVTPPASLLEAMRAVLPDAPVLPIGTSARVGGTTDCDVEAMEGFAVLRAAQLAGVPAIEIRAIANDIEEEDRARWHFDTAFESITAITPMLVEAAAELMAREPRIRPTPAGAVATSAAAH